MTHSSTSQQPSDSVTLLPSLLSPVDRASSNESFRHMNACENIYNLSLSLLLNFSHVFALPSSVRPCSTAEVQLTQQRKAENQPHARSIISLQPSLIKRSSKQTPWEWRNPWKWSLRRIFLSRYILFSLTQLYLIIYLFHNLSTTTFFFFFLPFLLSILHHLLSFHSSPIVLKRNRSHFTPLAAFISSTLPDSHWYSPRLQDLPITTITSDMSRPSTSPQTRLNAMAAQLVTAAPNSSSCKYRLWTFHHIFTSFSFFMFGLIHFFFFFHFSALTFLICTLGFDAPWRLIKPPRTLNSHSALGLTPFVQKVLPEEADRKDADQPNHRLRAQLCIQRFRWCFW